MTTWVGSISYKHRSNWDVCKRRALFGSGNWRARHVKAGDELMIWGSDQGWLGHCVALEDARPPTQLADVPWPDPAKYKALIPIRLVAEPVAPIPMRKPELAQLGLETWDLRQFPEIDRASAEVLRGLLQGSGRPSRIEAALASILAERRAFPARTSMRFFGEVPFPAGTSWASRADVARAGVHRPTQSGISGTQAEGADSVVVNGGYEDDTDRGEEIIYTGAGGNDSATGRQVEDQSLNYPGNAGLVTSQTQGLPVRVIRGVRGDPRFSPGAGYRYDGLFRVDDHWSVAGKSGFRVWQFLLVRLSPSEALPYTPAQHAPTGTQAPATSRGIVTRVARDTKVSRYVKAMYGNRCQVCLVQLQTPGGTLSEAAHIRALGRPHSGPDTPENVLCLCPNHHSLFDQGGIYLTDDFHVRDHHGRVVGELHRDRDHRIDIAHLGAHRERWGY